MSKEWLHHVPNLIANFKNEDRGAVNTSIHGLKYVFVYAFFRNLPHLCIHDVNKEKTSWGWGRWSTPILESKTFNGRYDIGQILHFYPLRDAKSKSTAVKWLGWCHPANFSKSQEKILYLLADIPPLNRARSEILIVLAIVRQWLASSFSL